MGGLFMLRLSSPEFGRLVESFQTFDQAASSDSSDKRQATRMAIQTPFTIAGVRGNIIGNSYSVLSRDLSICGIGFFQTAPAVLGENFLACFPYGKESLVVRCRVMFCKTLAQGLFGVGAQFEDRADTATVAQMENAIDPAERRIQSAILD
jgi:hypothetical protein